MRQNLQTEMEALLQTLKEQGRRPRLLLHACCAPCSSYCVPAVCGAFDTTVYFYNPNIAPEEEYRFRLQELRRLLGVLPLPAPVALQEGPYDPQRFADIARGHEADPEPGERCRLCYTLRLRATAQAAATGGYEWFGTTLSVSPHKKADWLYEIGCREGQAAGVKFLPSDFKKKGGYAQSIQLSKKYDLYRQDYCGCVYSAAARQRQLQSRAAREAAMVTESAAAAETPETPETPATAITREK